MVAINREQGAMIKDVVCPQCGKPISLPTILWCGEDRYGRITRSYLGGCLGCLRGFVVVQFLRDEKWFIHKYRYYAVPATKKVPLAEGNWIILNELPEAPPIIVGPGSGYDKQIELEASYFNLFRALQKALKSTGEILRQLLAIHTRGEKQ